MSKKILAAAVIVVLVLLGIFAWGAYQGNLSGQQSKNDLSEIEADLQTSLDTGEKDFQMLDEDINKL